MRRILWASLLAALSAAPALTWSGDAAACGGCFIQPVQGNDSGTIVTSHRMALSISEDQTILWDQIQYTGSPAGFAWVLPVKPGARIEVGSEAWFDVLDAATGTAISPPRLACKSPGFFGCSTVPGAGVASFGCGASDGEGGLDLVDPDPVQVVSHGATGPYESAIIHSDKPGALSTWLEEHSYAIPADIKPIIDAYQSEGFDFAALRLLPAAGVQQMRPVRVVQKGAAPVLPLRMVAAGTGARTAITLFVIGEGRYTTKNIPEVSVPRDLVYWNFTSESSNYAVLRDTVYGEGTAFFTPYSEPGALFDQVVNPVSKLPTRYQTTNNWQFETLAEAFAEQAFVNGETSSSDCADEIALRAFADESRRVVKTCDDALDPACAIDPANEVDARYMECDPPIGSDIPLDDLAQAMIGMHPSDVWITRLEANLTRDSLGADLEIEAAPHQAPQHGQFAARFATNIPPTCQLADSAAPPLDSDGGARGDKQPPGRLAPALFLGALGLLLTLRRLAAASKRGRPLAQPARSALEAAR